jgi:hypothetical protein
VTYQVEQPKRREDIFGNKNERFMETVQAAMEDANVEAAKKVTNAVGERAANGQGVPEDLNPNWRRSGGGEDDTYGAMYGSNFNFDDRIRAAHVFDRYMYDADKSGTCTTPEEAEDMTLNILYGFCTPGTMMCKVAEMNISRKRALKRLEELSDISDDNAMTSSDFWTWFVATFDDAVNGWEA